MTTVLPRTRRTVLVLVALALLTTGACSDAHTEADKYRVDNGTNPNLVRVYVSKELTPLLQSLVDAYTKENSGISFIPVTQTFSTSAKQIDNGSRPDLWVDTAAAFAPVAKGLPLQGGPIPVAADPLVWVVQPGNPRGIRSLTVFEKSPDIQTALCNDSMPCGSAAGALLAEAGVTPAPDFTPTTADKLISNIIAGKINTGIVFSTQLVANASAVSTIPLPDPHSQEIVHQMLRFTDNPTSLDFALWCQRSPEALAALAPYGLAQPNVA